MQQRGALLRNVARSFIRKRLRHVEPEPYLKTQVDTKPYLVSNPENLTEKAEIFNRKTIKRGLQPGETPVPVVHSLYPIEVKNLDLGRKYSYCRCGMSRYQPFCDRSHTNTAFKPLVFTIEEPVEAIYLCACKLTTKAPFCDNTTCAGLRKQEKEAEKLGEQPKKD